MEANTTIDLCRRYEGARNLRERDRLLRTLRYALEEVEGPERSHVTAAEIDAAWQRLGEQGEIGAEQAAALRALYAGYSNRHRQETAKAGNSFAQAAEAAAKLTSADAGAHLHCLARLGRLLIRCDERRYDDALQEGDGLAADCDALDLPGPEAERQHILGLAHRRRGEAELALTALNAALHGYRLSGDDVGAARVQDTLGMVYMDRGEFDEAMYHFQASFAAKTRCNDRPGLAITSGNIGRLYLQWEEFERAQTFLEQDLEISEERNDERGQLTALAELARAALGREQVREARDTLARAYRLLNVAAPAARQDAYSRANLHYTDAWVSLAEGEVEQAWTEHTEAAAIFGPAVTTGMRAFLDLQRGVILAWQRNYGSAQVSLDAAIQTFGELKQPGRLASACFECAMMLHEQGRIEDAAAYLSRALDQARALSAARMIRRFQSGSERLQREALLHALLESKQANERLRREIAAHRMEIDRIVHDVRSPLQAIQGALYLALALAEQQGEGGHADVEQMQYALAQSNWQKELISSILDVGRLRAGGVAARPEPLSTSEPLHEMVSWFGLEARQNQLELRVDPASEDLTLLADRALVRRMLCNLVKNALKYGRAETPDAEGGYGAITLSARREGDFARITVQDQGRGIPEAKRAVLFAEYGQLEPGQDSHSTGLGLNFCKLAAEAQGGRIGVESEPGHGCAFWFTLPLA